MTLPTAILHVLATMSLMCSLNLAPVRQPYEPDPAEVEALAKTVWAEARGCSERQQKAVCWCVFNRVDDERFPDTVIAVLTAPYQFAYRESSPVTEELAALARGCLTDWHSGSGRVLEPEFLYFTGDGRINTFRTEYNGGEAWAEE